MISIGVDLGKAMDYTAIAVVVRTETAIHHSGNAYWQARTEHRCEAAELIHMERLPAGTSFTEAVRCVKQVTMDPALGGEGRKRVVVDATGLGSPVVEMMRTARMECELRPVVITGGSGQRYGNGSWYVAKADLMTGLRTSMEQRDLRIAATMGEAPALVKELTAFGGNSSAGTTHDDMVMALALALWGVRRTPGGTRVA